MQIGGPEIGKTPLPPTGPSLASSQAAGLYGAGTFTRVHTSTASTSASGPTSFTHSFTATQPGSSILEFVAVSASSGAALGPTPAGWTQLLHITQSTLDVGVYVYLNAPAGTSSFALSAITATAGGAAAQQYEIADARGVELQYLFSNSGSGTAATTQSGSAVAPSAIPAHGLGCVAYALTGGATFTNSGSGTGMSGGVVQTSSTNGVTNNASLVVPSNGNNLLVYLGSPASVPTFKFAGTLSVSQVWAAALLIVDGIDAQSYVGAFEPSGYSIDQGAGYGTSATGARGWAVGNTTSPGAAGGNQ